MKYGQKTALNLVIMMVKISIFLGLPYNVYANDFRKTASCIIAGGNMTNSQCYCDIKKNFSIDPYQSDCWSLLLNDTKPHFFSIKKFTCAKPSSSLCSFEGNPKLKEFELLKRKFGRTTSKLLRDANCSLVSPECISAVSTSLIFSLNKNGIKLNWGMLQTIFDEAIKDTESFLNNKLSNSKADEKVAEKVKEVLAKLKLVDFDDPENARYLLQFGNAGNGEGSIYTGTLPYIVGSHPDLVRFILLHEIGHSFDLSFTAKLGPKTTYVYPSTPSHTNHPLPDMLWEISKIVNKTDVKCFERNRNNIIAWFKTNYGIDYSEQYEAEYEAVQSNPLMSVFIPEGLDCTVSQLSEAYSDYFATSVIAFTDNKDLATSITNGIINQCYSYDNHSKIDPHPSVEQRVDDIIFTHNDLRQSFHCEDKNGVYIK